MARTKTDKSIWMIFFESVKIFTMNLHKFLLYMAFPVLGTILGTGLIFGLTFWFNNNIDRILLKYPALDNMTSLTIVIILLALPGLLILLKAFGDFLIAYGALNSMAEGAITTGRVYDFPAHNAVVKSRILTFIMLWILFGIFTAFASFPLFWVLGGIFFIYFILIFQVFTFDENVSAINCFKESLQLIKGKFARTAILLIIQGLILFLVYHGLTVLFEVCRLNEVLTRVFSNWAMSLPLDRINAIYQNFNILITPDMIAKYILSNMTGFIALGFTLPLRSISWTLWYKNLAAFTENTERQPQKKQKKTAQKKLDKNILKRAMQDDEEF